VREIDVASTTRRRKVAIQQRDVQVMELLVERRAETLDVLHEELFAGRSRKRALNRLGELCTGGFLERTHVAVPGHDEVQNVYTLTPRGRRALELRSPAAVAMFAGRRFNETLRTASLPHQVVTNRAADRLGVRLTPEHLLPPPRYAHSPKAKPDGVYDLHREYSSKNKVWLEVDLGHYSRQRLLEKVDAAAGSHDVRGMVIVCPSIDRADRVESWCRYAVEKGDLILVVRTLEELHPMSLPIDLRPPAAAVNDELPELR
jgi:hypothetical protein